MFQNKYSVFTIVCLTFIMVKCQYDDLTMSLFNGDKVKKAEITMYYECHCKGCRVFDTVELSPTVEKIGQYMNLNLYPYGRAKTFDKGNGDYDFECRHGPEECYGNKLHVCAMDYLGNMTKAVIFNSCMMEFSHTNKGSDDVAADKCGKAQNIDPSEIKKCAKSKKGSQLLKKAGDATKNVVFRRVPYILLNGKHYKGDDFFHDVCDTFDVPPPECLRCLSC